MPHSLLQGEVQACDRDDPEKVVDALWKAFSAICSANSVTMSCECAISCRKNLRAAIFATGSMLREKVVDGVPKSRQILLDHSPDNLEIDAEVVVNDLVSQAGNLFPGNGWVL
jgi:hypothetical protein